MDQALSPGENLEQQYRGAGFSDDEINDWKSKRVADYQKAGFSDKEINDYFGVKETDTAGMKAYVQKNLEAFKESRKAADGTPQKEAASFGEAFDAGWEGSVTGLAKAGHLPDTVLPEHAGFFSRLASNVGQLAGDVPAMVTGAIGGMMAGAPIGGAIGTSVLPGVGTLGGIAAGSVYGGAAGAFAAPAAMRRLLMDHYEKGDVQNAQDFLARLASVTWDGIKGGTVGVLTAGAGNFVKPLAGPMAGLTAELATMTTAGAAMEGRLPDPQEFVDGAVLLGGFHLATGTLPGKLREIYSKTGERPGDVIEKANGDPAFKQELLAENKDLPKEAEPPAPKESPSLPSETMPPDELRAAREKRAEEIKNLGPTPEEKFTGKNGQEFTISAAPHSEWDNKSRWSKEDTGGVDVPVRNMRIEVRDSEGKVVGFTEISNRRGWPDKFFADETNVDEGVRRNGLANAMYDYAEKNGMPMRPGRLWGEGTHALWAKRDVSPGLWAKSTDEDFQGRVTQRVRTETELDKALSGEGGKPPTPPIETLTGDEPPGKPPEPEDLAAARERVNSRLAENKASGEPGILTKEWWSEKTNAAYTALVDRLNPLNEAVKAMASDNLPDSMNPYVLARNFPGWKGKAESFLSQDKNVFGKVVGEGGTIDFKTGKRNGESLENVLRDVKPGEQNEFMAYALSRRAIERNEADKATGIKLDDAKLIEKADRERFGAIFDRLSSWNDRVMQYARDADLISEEVYNRIKKGSKDYLPLMREQDFDEFTGKTKGRDGGLYQEMEGSTRKILNPVEQMMRNAMRVVKAADLNQVRMAFGDMIDENGFGIGEKIEKPTGADNEISFKRDGELQTYKVKTEYAEAIKSLNADPGKTALWARMLMAPAGWLRTGTVLNPDFIVRHGERGLFVSAVQSKSLGGVLRAPVDVARAMYGNVMAIGDIMKNSETYQAFMRSGAAQSTIFGMEDYLGKQNFWDLNRESGNFMSKAWNTFKSPLEYMAHLSDNIARVAEFKRAGGVGGDLNAQVEAAFRSREVTLDYMRAGAQIKAMSSFVPFMNIGIQGIDRMARGWSEDKIGFTARAAAALTVPTLLNWAANRHDSRYQDAPNWEKDLYWIIPTNKWEKAANLADFSSRPEDLRRLAADGSMEVNNGTTLRISKPFELGLLFASVPERLANRFFDEDPRAGSELVSTLIHGALPNVLPAALTPVLEQGTNKNFFTGRPVVSSHAEGLLPEYQYNEYTSTVAKQLGKVIAYVPGLRDIGPKDAKLASPQVIDNYIHDWSGTLGQYALSVIDKAEQGMGIVNKPPPPASTLGDMWFIKAFIARHPSQNLQPIQDFYDDFEKATRLNTTISDLTKKGDQDSLKQAMELQQSKQGDMLRLTEIKKSLGTISKTLQGINDAPGLKPDEKRQLMDGAYYQMSMIAKTGNKIMDQYRKQVNAQNSGGAQ